MVFLALIDRFNIMIGKVNNDTCQYEPRFRFSPDTTNGDTFHHFINGKLDEDTSRA